MFKVTMNKTKVIWISGALLTLIMGLVAFYGLKICSQDIGCLIFIVIAGYPGLSLGLEGFSSILVSLIFWFLIGSFTGFLISKVKKY